MDELLCKYVSHCFNYCNLDPNGLTHNRFVDRDMFMQYIGGGIGHLEQFSLGNDGDEDPAVQRNDCVEVEKDMVITETDEGEEDGGDDEEGEGDSNDDDEDEEGEEGEGDGDGDGDEDEDEDTGTLY